MSKITKLGLGIICFEGTEHLKNITYELRPLCDHIVICLQRTSYFGDPIKGVDIDEAMHLCDCKLVDEVIWFEPTDLHKTERAEIQPRLIETDKRNFILQHLEQNVGCSHSLVIDSDEFYDRTDFARAKEIITNTPELKVVYCQYVNYYRDYRHLLVWPFLAYVPFITESKYRFNFHNGSFDKPSDPTRRYLLTKENTCYHILPYNIVKMHHLSWIRIDISQKINSWSSKKYFENMKGLTEAAINRYTNFEDGDNAIILFNVPGCQVLVNKLPKQYIHPKYKLNDTAQPYESSNTNS